MTTRELSGNPRVVRGRNGMEIQYIPPGEPNRNAYVERFNRTFRNELLDLYLFGSLDEVR